MAGKMKNCPMCGKLFLATNTMRVCRDCLEKEHEMESNVVNYVRQHPDCNIPEIIKETGAPEKMIRRLIKEGRFVEAGVKITYPCEKCGAPISTGKLCNKCAEALRAELQATNAKNQAMAAKKAAPDPRAKGKGVHSKSLS